jgi:hypothetical protein
MIIIMSVDAAFMIEEIKLGSREELNRKSATSHTANVGG